MASGSTAQLSHRTSPGGPDRSAPSAGSSLLPMPMSSMRGGGEEDYADSSDDDDTFLFPRIEKRRDTESPADSPGSGSLSHCSKETAGIGEGTGHRFHGKSSFLPFVSVTRRYMRSVMGHGGISSSKDDSAGEECQSGLCGMPPGRRQIFWTVAPVSHSFLIARETYSRACRILFHVYPKH